MTLFIPLILVISDISSAQSVTKKTTGDSIVLQPGNKPEQLNSVVWKHGEHRAAEWYEGDADESYYRIFDGSSVLNKSTCSLTINNLDKRFNGTYTAEINGLNPTKSEKLEVLDPVSNVTISLDRNCDDDKSDNCTLTCKGTGDGPLKYKWTPSLSSASVVMVPKAEKDTEYACEVSNPVSSQEGKYTMRVKGSQDPGPVAAAILVPLVGLGLLIAAAIGAFLWCKIKGGQIMVTSDHSPSGEGKITNIYAGVGQTVTSDQPPSEEGRVTHIYAEVRQLQDNSDESPCGDGKGEGTKSELKRGGHAAEDVATAENIYQNSE